MVNPLMVCMANFGWFAQTIINMHSAQCLKKYLDGNSYKQRIYEFDFFFNQDGTFELNHPFDLNLYLDTILKVVLEHGGNRKVVFSSFHPDICAMMRLKQNKYPVVFLTQGVTAKYPTYHDTRCQNIPMAMRHALASDILGINVHTEDILRDSSLVKLVKDSGLIIFCWGDDNNDKDTIQHLKKLGLHAVIYDK